MNIKAEIRKFRRVLYFKFTFAIIFITISLISIIFLLPPHEPVFHPEDYTLNWVFISLFSCFTLILTSYSIVLTVNQYKDYVRRKTIILGNQSLSSSFEGIFKNENRINIIKKILENPGIHNNELLRQCKLHKGQLQWHLEVLLKYSIIKREKLGHYVSYLSVLTPKEMKRIPLKLISKSTTSMLILGLIEKNPGIISATIAGKLNMRRSSVKYHIDKLAKMDLIVLSRNNREIKLFINSNISKED